ncbi:hypothetical protein RGF97_04045 [Streptomyces roseicoloratus]|uniref:Uncharacterized protein n=1 Tax=Streptomyces roseicoloratus TaxID=2508722 RepID=A0ABY9RPT4_9ACTN|nr:hypothetical protein [Streptomyces roseicoloratus]WMX44196.1 hypothetical protein RGF97_04045 [Streptomyces roseicoloratus]
MVFSARMPAPRPAEGPAQPGHVGPAGDAEGRGEVEGSVLRGEQGVGEQFEFGRSGRVVHSIDLHWFHTNQDFGVMDVHGTNRRA